MELTRLSHKPLGGTAPAPLPLRSCTRQGGRPVQGAGGGPPGFHTSEKAAALRNTACCE